MGANSRRHLPANFLRATKKFMYLFALEKTKIFLQLLEILAKIMLAFSVSVWYNDMQLLIAMEEKL
jgi:hypothetical protein